MALFLILAAGLPKSKLEKREIWTAETLMEATRVCDDERLKLAMNVAFACSLRKVFLPKIVAEMLVEWKKEQDRSRKLLGEAFYQKKDQKEEENQQNVAEAIVASGLDPEVLTKVLQNPDLLVLIQALGQSKK